jgi:hypothetical protein
MGVSGQRHPRPRFTPVEITPDIHWIGTWVGLRAGLDTEAIGNIFASAGGRTPFVQSVVRFYTDSATPAPYVFIQTHLKHKFALE